MLVYGYGSNVYFFRLHMMLLFIYLFIIDPYRSGGDLRFHLSTKQHDENTIKFWMAELICAVKYLHSQGIVHR